MTSMRMALLSILVVNGAGLWLRAQQPASRKAFEVAAIRVCRDGDALGGSKSSQGRLSLGCLPVSHSPACGPNSGTASVWV